MIAEILSTMCAGVFGGAATYITFVEHPARLECGTDLAAREFGPSYRRAALMQASLALVGLAAGLVAWLQAERAAWLVGALLLGSAVPFTLLVIKPTNDRLLDPTLEPGSPEAAELLARWGRLHAVRTVIGLAAFACFVWALSRPDGGGAVVELPRW